MCGWVVKFKGQKQTFHEYFHDGAGGPPESLRQAIAHRDAQIQRLPTPGKIWVTSPKEKGGPRGVTRTTAATPSGHVAESWVVTRVPRRTRRPQRRATRAREHRRRRAAAPPSDERPWLRWPTYPPK
jgi:hypothetical protein